jgi:hypothetical protein
MRRRMIFTLVIAALFLTPTTTPLTTQAAPDDPNPCVGLASDSNGFGHVTVQLPDSGAIGIVYITTYGTIMREQLDAFGLHNLQVTDRSLSASSLTATPATNYLASIPYGNLINDRCKYIMVGPFLPDVAAWKATPAMYSAQLQRLVNGLIENNPRAVIFVFTHYLSARADFTASNSGFGMVPERINAFTEQVKQACRPDGGLGLKPQVICVDTQAILDGTPYVFDRVTRNEWNSIVARKSSFATRVQQYFEDTPDGVIIGDGIHLSYAGRVRLLGWLAETISRMSDF